MELTLHKNDIMISLCKNGVITTKFERRVEPMTVNEQLAQIKEKFVKEAPAEAQAGIFQHIH
jgi:hypothetical protein